VSLAKLGLDEQGAPVEDRELPAGGCLSCLEAEDETHRCCNTCQELKAAYQARGLPHLALGTSPQCQRSVGCRIRGAVVVNKVSGNVHVALGHSIIRDGKHVHEFDLSDVSEGFNTSHEIHSVTFGDAVPGTSSPLDGMVKTVRHGAFMFHYYIKLVPTVLTNRYGEEVYTHQYSVTDTARNVQVRNGELSGLPGVFLVYDFSPFLMQKREKTKPWSYLFTSACAIIGGVFTMATLVERAVRAGLGLLPGRAGGGR